MAISVRRLAQLAGTSPSTASRALRGHDDVNAETQRKILALAREHDFPLPAIRSQNKPRLLNVMCSLIELEGDGDCSNMGFNRRILAGLQQGADECEAELANFRPNPRTWPLVVNRRQVDGVVLLGGDEYTAVNPASSPPVPGVFVFSGPEDADVVTIDNFDAGRKLGRHLAALGHRRVAYIGPNTDMSGRRLFGLRAGLEPKGGAVPVEYARMMRRIGSREDAGRLTDSLVSASPTGAWQPESFTALAVYNDYMAAAAVLRLRECGIRVPEDVSVVGFDDVRPYWYDGPKLTTAAIPLEDIGAEAGRLLNWRLAHPHAPSHRLLLVTPLVKGETTVAIRTT